MNVISGQVNLSAPARKKINIATPAYGSVYCSEYVKTLYLLLSQCGKRGISFSFSDIDYSDIVISRNYLLSNFFFNKQDCSHILFMDSDMGFPPELIFQMLELNEDVVGAVCPKRSLDLRKLHSDGDIPFSQAFAKALDFVGVPGEAHPRNKDFRHVPSCGTGILLISRQCVESMLNKCPDIDDRVRFKRMPYAAKFERFLTPFSKITLEDRELSEDLSFCHRWVNRCKGNIYASVALDVEHVARVCIKAKWTDL